MTCSNCGTTFNDGKFCPSCGTPATTQNESAQATSNTQGSTGTTNAAETVAHSAPSPEAAASTEQAQSQEFVGNVRQTSSSFGQFFTTLLKNPSAAKHANANDFVSGLISLVILALVVGIRAWLLGHDNGVEFVDAFLKPFAKSVLFLAILTGGLIGASIIAKQEYDPKEIVAKYGAYIVPFMLVFALGVIFELLDIDHITGTTIALGQVGFYLVAPAFVLLTRPSKGIDIIYLIVILGFIGVFFNGYLEIGFYEIPSIDKEFDDLKNFLDF